MKYCPDCKQNKPKSEFYASKQTTDGLFGFCKACVIERRHEYEEKNADKIKKYKYDNRIKRAEQCRQWRIKNKKKRLAYKREYERNKKKTDIGYRMLANIRSRIRQAMITDSKTSPTRKLLGCSIPELKAHLESQFKDSMSWDNYGRTGWHIDHIKPCSSFDMSKASEQEECFHYTNLQPLWHTDNLKKGAKIL